MESKKYFIDDKIIKAKIDDSTEIAKLIKSSWNSAYKGLISDEFLNNMDIEKLAQAWKKNIIQSSNIYVYKEKNEILGVIRFGESEENSEFGEVFVFYVKPEEKRKGLGTKLWDFAKQELIKQGYKNILVWCLKGNKQGTNFYGKMKGEYIGEREANVNGVKIKEIGFKYNLIGDLKMEEIILVRPSERRNGYATQMLNKALDFCKNELKLEKVMVNCNKENEGSRKTILKAGGVLERENVTEDGENMLIHWINL